MADAVIGVAWAADFAGLLAWRHFVGGEWHSRPVGLQPSRIGDACSGRQAKSAPYSRAAATDFDRLPEHEVRGSGGGAKPAVGCGVGGQSRPFGLLGTTFCRKE